MMEEGYVEVQGTRLYYEASGSGSAVVLLHGFTLDRRMWRPQVEALSRRHRVVAYDARGFGRSAPPGTEAYRHCDDAAALCEALGLSRAVVVGHSIGAHQMLELALSRPDRVAGYVAVAASGLASVPFPDDVVAMFGAIRAAAKAEGVDAAKRVWRRAAWLTSLRAEVGARVDAIVADYSGWHWTHDNPAKGLEPPAAQRLGELGVPAAIITGERDLAYNAAVADALTQGIAGATRVRLPEAGHLASLEEPDAVTAAIEAVVQRAGG